jgi:acyl carrier protein
MDIEKTLERFIVDELLLGKRATIGVDESLIGSGILDSLTLLELIAFVEKRFNLKVADSDMVPDNFKTIARIKTFIETRA